MKIPKAEVLTKLDSIHNNALEFKFDFALKMMGLEELGSRANNEDFKRVEDSIKGSAVSFLSSVTDNIKDLKKFELSFFDRRSVHVIAVSMSKIVADLSDLKHEDYIEYESQDSFEGLGLAIDALKEVNDEIRKGVIVKRDFDESELSI